MSSCPAPSCRRTPRRTRRHSACAAPRVTPPDSLAGFCSTDPSDRAAHTHGKAFRDVVRNLHGQLENPPDLVVRPRTEQDVVDVARLVLARAGRRHPVRRRQLGRGRGRGAVRRARRLARPRRPRPRARDRPDQPGSADPGRGARPAPRGPAPAARADPAPLPAVVRVVHARRLAGHPGRRALRDAVHPHRRPHRVAAGGHAGRHQRVPPAAGVRGRAVTGPAVPRLGGHARRDHRGMDAAAGPAAVAGHRVASPSTSTPTPSRPRGRSRSPGCTPPTAGCSTRPRPSSTPARR